MSGARSRREGSSVGPRPQIGDAPGTASGSVNDVQFVAAAAGSPGIAGKAKRTGRAVRNLLHELAALLANELPR